jgi:Membrane bound O-acyl transferase family
MSCHTQGSIPTHTSIVGTRFVPAAPTFGFLDWMPVLALPLVAVAAANRLSPWAFMWSLAFAIYAGFKWLSWRRCRLEIAYPRWRAAAYLLAWPGMDAKQFLNAESRVEPPRAVQWLGAASITALGGALLWCGARALPAGHPLLRGWTGMLGFVLLAHFGAFKLLALLWWRVGVDAVPIMAAPLRSASLSEFWGKRWNLGFRRLAHDFVFTPAYKTLGVRAAGFVVFAFSGLLHDFVISLPARGGFGLPTLYFALQGVGVAIERSALGKKLGLRHGIRGWLFMAAITAGPAFVLFHPPFVLRVILPFMKAVHAL